MHKPARHVVMSFASADDATAVVLMLHEIGLAGGDIACYTPQQMRAQAAIARHRVSAGRLRSHMPELVSSESELARQGHSFVLVRAGNDRLLQSIGCIASEAHSRSMRVATDRVTRFAPSRAAKDASGPVGPALAARWRAVNPAATPAV